MEKKYLYWILSFTLSFIFKEILSQTTIDTEFRPRMEFRQGFRKPLADTLSPAFVTLQRTRLNADYKGKILNARLSFQDARVWGNSDNKTNTSKIEIYEAWFEYLICSGFSIQMGRQPLKYDDQRLLAAPAWSNTSLSHDFMLIKYNNSFIQTHAGFAYNNSKDTLMNTAYSYTPKQNYKTMSYLWLTKPLVKGVNLSVIGICEGFENKTDTKIIYPRITYGGNLVYSYDSSAFSGTLTAYFQNGKDPNKVSGSGYADLKSYFLAAKASYKVLKIMTATLGFDYYSGSEADIDATKSNVFNRLYGSTHSYNGSMEYFVSLPAQGLIDYYAGITTKINTKISADLTTHTFYFNKDFIYKNEKLKKNIGTEADFTMNYNVSKEISIQGGFSMYFNSGSTKKYFKMQGVGTYPQQWAYLMLTVKPQLYKTPPVPESK